MAQSAQVFVRSFATCLHFKFGFMVLYLAGLRQPYPFCQRRLTPSIVKVRHIRLPGDLYALDFRHLIR